MQAEEAKKTCERGEDSHEETRTAAIPQSFKATAITTSSATGTSTKQEGAVSMTEMQDIRSKYEAILDLRYDMRLHFLHARLYRHLRAGAAILSLLAGSAAIVSVLQTLPGGLLVAGVVVAAASAADILFRWAEKAAHHDVLRRRLAEILSRESELSLEALDSELARYEVEADDEIESLRVPAYNDNLRSNGREDLVRPESLSARLFRLIA